MTPRPQSTVRPLGTLAAATIAAAVTIGVCTAAPPLRVHGQQEVLSTTEAHEVVNFWRAAGHTLWFAKDPNFDRLFRDRFADTYEAAAQGKLSHWEQTPESALALLLLLDQYPRNSVRGTPRMYATDALARTVADRVIATGHDKVVSPDLAVFFYLPFGHSEILADQERAVALCERLGEPNLTHAKRHRDIIRRFGRFPHRNPILGRVMTAEEQLYLDHGGYRG
jgi:uncharacterized protein (DUF924 family)